jgi:predicted GIY-YIG superfamily endonuclease
VELKLNIMEKLLSKEEILLLPKYNSNNCYIESYIYFVFNENEIYYIGISSTINNRLTGRFIKKYGQKYTIYLLTIRKRDVSLEGEYIFKFTPKRNRLLSSKTVYALNRFKNFKSIDNSSINIHTLNGNIYISKVELQKIGYRVETEMVEGSLSIKCHNLIKIK